MNFVQETLSQGRDHNILVVVSRHQQRREVYSILNYTKNKVRDAPGTTCGHAHNMHQTHLWHFIRSSRYLNKKYRDIIQPQISRDAGTAVPENMLLAMLADERCHNRTLAARQMIKAREIGPDGICVLIFVIPAVKFRATEYVDLIDWQACNVTPSTVLRHISCH
ncbi:hypothetical protein AVEN_155821-1 [Araneus ventricosus]|uniref:Uncharacterized protein n=1 Tax=Araneus ventricosus TaxID=182803 RepID=A0A4Y2GAR6_ARAVE|nr:hypothetical protein AVEN_155821-1 [Araneus ventricosus]